MPEQLEMGGINGETKLESSDRLLVEAGDLTVNVNLPGPLVDRIEVQAVKDKISFSKEVERLIRLGFVQILSLKSIESKERV